MKKNSFVEGTFVATLAVIITKILGILYVIPFYKIVGEQGGALYAYAYNVYQIFLSVSTAGIPIALSKLISEYNTLELYEAKERVYRVGRNTLTIISVILFFLLFIFAEEAAVLILGEIEGGNTIADVVFVIRCVSFCLLVIPFLSITRGYLQGHRFIASPSVSQIIEQFVRVLVILLGSYLTLKLFKGSLTLAVGISVFAAFLGGLAALIYLKAVISKNKKSFNIGKSDKKDNVSNKEIFNKIISYSIPLIIVTLASNIYAFVNMILINRGLHILKYNGELIEVLTTLITTWTPKIAMIVNSIAIGMCMSLIPYIVESFVKKEYADVSRKFNRALQIVLLTSVPMVAGIFILAQPVFSIFYGSNPYGPGILRIVIINSLIWNIYLVTSMVLQSLNKFKLIYFTTFLGIILNIILNIPLILLLDYIGLPAHYGATVASMFCTSLTVFIALKSVKKEYNISYKPLINTMKKLVVPTSVMCIILWVLSFIIPLTGHGFVMNIIVCMIYAIIGATIFIYLTYKNKELESVLTKEYLNNIVLRIKRILHVK